MNKARALLWLLVVAALAAGGCGSRSTPPDDARASGDSTVDVATQCAAGDPPLLSARIVRDGADYRLELRNVGCGAAVRLQGCCGEGLPWFEALDGSGAWQQTQCLPATGACCAALQSCNELVVGGETSIDLGDLALCKGRVVRARIGYGDACDAKEPWSSKMTRTATSSEITL